MTPKASATTHLDELLAEAKVLVVAGSGGSGKTTISAALGLRAAQLHNRRTLVVTVDPARRLSDALGVSDIAGEPVLVPVGSGSGRLWVHLVEMSQAWDVLVRRCSPTEADADALLKNRLFGQLTTRFVASHDFVALDHLCDLDPDDGRPEIDLVIVDTPPAEYAVDVFDGPGRMREFFNSRLLRWLTVGAGTRSGGAAALGRLASRPFLMVAERLLGKVFLSDIGEFFSAFAKIRPAFLARIERVEKRLSDPRTFGVIVASPNQDSFDLAGRLRTDMESRSIAASSVVLNRVWPTASCVSTAQADGLQSVALSSSLPADPNEISKLLDDHGYTSDSLRSALAAALEQMPNAKVNFEVPVSVVAVGWQASGAVGLAELGSLLDTAKDISTL